MFGIRLFATAFLAVRHQFILWLANCYFAHDSSGFPAVRRFCDAQSGRANLAMRM
jgi:hypothetical protein